MILVFPDIMIGVIIKTVFVEFSGESVSHYSQAKFSISAPDISHLGPDEGIEIAFAGRSNAGKSSALNKLTRQKGLARTSKTPGRTQLINVFQLDENRRLIDLPGYGYAKVPIAIKKKWQESLGEYLQKRESIKGLVVLMDIRHPFKDLDQDLIHWAVAADLPVLALLTKADKFKAGKRKNQLMMAQEAALAFCGDVTVDIFSSLSGIGLENLQLKLDDWFGYEKNII